MTDALAFADGLRHSADTLQAYHDNDVPFTEVDALIRQLREADRLLRYMTHAARRTEQDRSILGAFMAGRDRVLPRHDPHQSVEPRPALSSYREPAPPVLPPNVVLLRPGLMPQGPR